MAYNYYLFNITFTNSIRSNTIKGLWVAIIIYMIFCAFQMKDSCVYRPHPILWRMVKGLFILYCAGLIFYSFQTLEDARYMLSYWDPKLGVPLPERSYAVDCALYTPNHPESMFFNLRETLFDEFILAHLIGWYMKYLMLRDVNLCIVSSIIFELYEITFEHHLPNFAECWWDHILLDGIICNGLGIYFGWLTLKFFNIERLKWMSFETVTYEEDGKQKQKTVWMYLVTFRHYVGTTICILVLGLIELNAFFLKFLLWTKPTHPLNFWRAMFWWVCGIPGTKEFYYYVRYPEKQKSIGLMGFLIIFNSIIEAIIWVKMGQGVFTKQMPENIKLAWIVFFIFFVIFTFIYFGIVKKKEKHKID
eukprot:TRINITY_DN773_c0_g1_i1.p1 TRINITY_DN773_c0_g1~~TRINITY_DN773_c0_g1_i1.p1  ORF type:complete len:362 (+),score=40.83 TRINITY_DN773_c0_g1_i1:237-1322(+)